MSWLLLTLLALAPVACGGPGPSESEDGGEDNGERTLTVLYTTDERGQIEGGPASEGPARLMGLWRTSEGFDESGDFLVLSGGNSWAGTVISSWFQGASTVEVMNTMRYAGAAIGSQDFQFGMDGLRDRAAESSFPLLSSNIRLTSNGNPPDFATPFTVRNVNGLQVGLVGLTLTSTPLSSVPAHVEGLEFRPYVDALTEQVPQVLAGGANVVIVLSQLCPDEMLGILPAAKALGVSVITGGFCGQTVSEMQDGVALVTPSWRFASYGKVTIRFRKGSREVLGIQSQVLANSGGPPDPEVEGVVQKWEAAQEADLAAVIGYVTNAIPDEDPALYNLVMDSWLFAYPNADIAMLNAGAVRQGLPAGDITKGAIVGMLPFENSLVELELTGAEVVDCLQNSTILAGLTTRGGYFHADGSPLKMDSTYHVLTTDFLYGQSNYNYSQYDADPIPTGVVYHQPTLTFLQSLETSPENPLDPFLDHTPRR